MPFITILTVFFVVINHKICEGIMEGLEDSDKLLFITLTRVTTTRTRKRIEN